MRELLIQVGYAKQRFTQRSTSGAGDGYIFLQGPAFALWALHAELALLGWPAWIRDVEGLHLMVSYKAKDDLDFLTK